MSVDCKCSFNIESNMLKNFINVLFVGCMGFLLSAQDAIDIKYVDVAQFRLMGSSSISDTLQFYRVKEELSRPLPPNVKTLANNTSGFNIFFKTNSTSIHIKWSLRNYQILSNMTPIAVAGFDLYGWNGEEWQFVTVARPTGIDNISTFVKNMNGEMTRFRMYFPLYSGVDEVRIGVGQNSKLLPIEDAYLPTLKIVAYGSSITQGASASRPGMAYTAILGRRLNVDVSNLGFSGAGKMELEVAKVVNKTRPDLFILDCVPNPSIDEIRARTVPFIEMLIKENPTVPILMVESVFREDGYWDVKKAAKVAGQNSAFKAAFESLKQRGIENVYYLDNTDLIGNDHEATIDGTHFTDLGHKRMADRLFTVITNILERKKH